MDPSMKVHFGTDATGRFFFLEKVANYIKMQYNTLATTSPLGYNVCIPCPIPLGEHKPTINALVEEFRESFASDAIIAFNSDYNAFYFDFT